MVLVTVVFARCDVCGSRWEAPPGYNPTPVQWGGTSGEADLCEECESRYTQGLTAVLAVLRTPAAPKRPHRRAPSGKPRPWVCSCGRDFEKKMHIHRHLTGTQGQGHTIETTPDQGDA